MAEKLSENFTLEEFTYSETAIARKISNKPSSFHKKIFKAYMSVLIRAFKKSF